jgi:aspartyl-tRNA(Asn)/glutamyl-tRNA(Gln) amidotransferase subunit C
MPRPERSFAIIDGWASAATGVCAAKAADAIGRTRFRPPQARQSGAIMSVDQGTVRRIAHLARVAVEDKEVEHLQSEINAILSFVEALGAVDVEGVEPMTSVMPMVLRLRQDEVTDGYIADDVVANAPEREDHFFVVPRVVE